MHHAIQVSGLKKISVTLSCSGYGQLLEGKIYCRGGIYFGKKGYGIINRGGG